jgi:hypothetical protein
MSAVGRLVQACACVGLSQCQGCAKSAAADCQAVCDSTYISPNTSAHTYQVSTLLCGVMAHCSGVACLRARRRVGWHRCTRMRPGSLQRPALQWWATITARRAMGRAASCRPWGERCVGPGQRPQILVHVSSVFMLSFGMCLLPKQGREMFASHLRCRTADSACAVRAQALILFYA